MPYAAEIPAVAERHVQAIWYDGALRPREMRTVRGGPMRVLDPGVWNPGPGPDFLHAVLEVGRGRRVVTGDVEVHLKPSGWTLHGHAADRAYRNVVAHVTWFKGAPPGDLPPGCISICIGDFLRTRTDFSPDSIDLEAYPYGRLPLEDRPCGRILSGNAGPGLALLVAAGRRRLEIKARRMRARIMRTGNPDQVVYEETLAAFGGGGNSGMFRALAARIGLEDLPRSGEHAFEALKSAAWLEPRSGARWRGSCVRPCNAPEIRLADAAAMFTGGKPGSIGPGTAAAVIANVIVPFAMARGVLASAPEWLPPETVNRHMRQTAFRLFGRDHNPAMYSGNGVMLQGLMQLRLDYCVSTRGGCLSCALAGYLNEYERQTKENASCHLQ